MAHRCLRAAVVALAAALVVVAAACTDDDPPPTPAATATVEATASPTAEATPAATIEPTPASGMTPKATSAPGEPLYPPLVEGDPATVPEGVSLFVWDGCYACDGPPTALMRIDGGTEEAVRVFEEDEPAPYIRDALIDGGTLYLFECTTGYCGTEGLEGQPASTTLHRSDDRGETWESLGEREGRSEDVTDWGVDLDDPPPVLDAFASDTGEYEVGGVTLNVADIDDRGLASAGYAMSLIDVSPGGRIAVAWAVRDPANVAPVLYLTVFRADGAPLATYASYANPGAWLTEDRLVVSLRSGDGPIPAIVDIFAGTVRPIARPFEDIDGRNSVLGVMRDGDG